MSDDATCDTCRADGRRRLGTFAPEGWFYVEVPIGEGDPDDTDAFILLACSEACTHLKWKKGPGKLDLTKEIPEGGSYLNREVLALQDRLAKLEGCFEWALQRLREGQAVRRKSWPSGMCIFRNGDDIEASYEPIWRPSSRELLARDWVETYRPDD